MIKVIDISVAITSQFPPWPGDPAVKFHTLSSIEKGDESNLTQISMSLHTGTHIDAPKHFLDQGITTDDIALSKLIGRVLVVEIDQSVDVITESLLINHPQSADIKETTKILFKTRNSSYWHSHPSEFQHDYVGIDASGAAYLAQFKPDLIGVDYYSVAPYADTYTPHHILLAQGIVLLESIDLTGVPTGYYQLICLPMKIARCEGVPARAILLDEAIFVGSSTPTGN